jgi:hypothetical protein
MEPMHAKGRQLAVSSAILAITAVVVAVLLLRGRIIEEWNIHRFRNGTPEDRQAAMVWMGLNGGEASLVAVMEEYISSDPWTFLIREHKREAKDVESLMEPLARIRYQDLKAKQDLPPALLSVSRKISERLTSEGVTAVFLSVLRRSAGGARLLVFASRAAIVNDFDFALGTEAIDLAVKRLRELLHEPDPLIRIGAAYGLADAGPRAGTGTITAIKPLLDDPDPVVHEAAIFAINRLSSPGTAEELPK